MTIYDISTTGALGIGLDISNEELEPITDNITLNGDITVSGAVEFGEDILVSLLISCSNNLIQDPASDIVINYAQPDACSVIWAEGDMTLYQIDSTGSLILGVNLFSGEEIVVQSNNIYLNDNITVTGIPLEEFPIGLLIGANVTLIQDPSTQINVTEGTLWVIGSGDITLDYIDCAGAISIGVNFDTLEPQVNSIHLTDNLIARGSIDFGEGGPEYSLVLMALLDITQDLGTAITVTGDGISQIELDGDLTLRNIVISNGDLEITAGDDVTIATITTLGTGLPSIFFDGSTHQDATLNSNTFALIEVTNASSGTVDFLDEFTTEDFTDVTAGSHLIFNAGDTYTITGTLTLRYANLNSSDGATRFAFDVTGGDQHTYNITVANSEALTHDIYTLDSIGEELIYNNDNFDPSPHWIFIYSNPYVPPEQPPELPPDPIIEPPIDPGDPGEPMIDEDGNIVNTGAYGDEEAKRYNTPKGVIRTIVIVYEGRVVVTPYDKSGLRYDETVTLTGGQKTIQERKVSEDVQNNKL
jgi:hypothetical protein